VREKNTLLCVYGKLAIVAWNIQYLRSVVVSIEAIQMVVESVLLLDSLSDHLCLCDALRLCRPSIESEFSVTS